MKRAFGLVIAISFVLTASAVYAQNAQQNPTANTPAAQVAKPATPPLASTQPATPVVKPSETDQTAKIREACKNKGLVGETLEACVKSELAKAETGK